MLVVGQVLWLKFKLNNRPGLIAQTVHPYIIVDINKENGIVELIQCDSLENKLHKAYFKENAVIDTSNEIVLDKPCYAQLDNCFMVEYSEDLEKYRQTEEVLSKPVFNELKRKYQAYQFTNSIIENKTVFMKHKELEKINS